MLSAAEDILQQKHYNTTNIETKCFDKITSRRCTVMTTGANSSLHNMRITSTQLFDRRFFIKSCDVFNRNTISTWSSGTGGAGIIGALAYAALTEPHLMNLSPKITLLIMLIVPLIFSLTYWCLLVLPESIHKIDILKPRTWIVPEKCLSITSFNNTLCMKTAVKDDEKSSIQPQPMKQRLISFKEMLLITVSLLRFMIPLMFAYIAEYLINQGIVQLIFYPCDRGWYLTPSSQYRWYQVLYQAGVFISRSSINIIQLPYPILILLPILQFTKESIESIRFCANNQSNSGFIFANAGINTGKSTGKNITIDTIKDTATGGGQSETRCSRIFNVHQFIR
ncbi:Battenin [Dirofilaria immitis]|nr:Battenin [Dirofilaria immitis]